MEHNRDWVCPICHDSYRSKHKDIVIIKHDCDADLKASRKRGHYFHQACVEQWKKSRHAAGESFVCPMDRDLVLRLYTVPDYEVVGLDLSHYDSDYAELFNRVKINDQLIKQMADVNIDEPDRNGKTLAYYASSYGNYTLVQKLLKHKADFNLPMGESRFTPLMMIICQNHVQIAKLLLQNNTVRLGIHAQDKAGRTAFEYACKYVRVPILYDMLSRELISKHQVRQALGLYYTEFKRDMVYGKEVLDVFRHYLKNR